MSALLVSDREREYTIGLLRSHWLTGRLTVEEFEQRVAEAWRARSAQDLWDALRWLPVDAPPAAAPRKTAGSAAWSLVLGLAGLTLWLVSLGLLLPLSLPMSVTAWALGREARGSPSCSARGVAVAGEVLGVIGALLSVLWLAGCASVVVLAA